MNQVIILAGGKGTRMQSDIPKVLQLVRGIPIIERIIKSVRTITARPVVVIGYQGDSVVSRLGECCEYVKQGEPLGTGHAVMSARSTLVARDYESIIVIPGDCPLISSETLLGLVRAREESQAVVVLAAVAVPEYEGDYQALFHYGRLVRDERGRVIRIIEFKDATEEERMIREVNTSIYCFDAAWLWDNIERLGDDNQAHEYYLTDMVALAHEQGRSVSAAFIEHFYEGLGVNNPRELAMIEQYCKEE